MVIKMTDLPTASPLKILKEKPKPHVGKAGEKICTTLDQENSARKILAVPAARLPHFILSHIFEYLPLRDVGSCMRVCRQWNSVLSNEDCSVWRALCRKHLSAEGVDFYLLAVSDVVTSKSKLRAFAYAWNPKDISKNNFIQTNGFTAHRQPIAQSTDGVRGKIGVKEGIHAFDITWEGPLGTVAVIGFATKHAALHCPGYVPLLGSDDQSWGWNLVDNSLLHNNKTLGVYPKINNPPKYLMGEKIRMIIDCDSHKAYFERGDDWMGIAFNELPPVCFYPSVCAVYGNTEVSMIYAGPAVLG